MPFTFAHPAIVLPLNTLSSKWLSLTGLIIGSLTPDFEYFLRMRIRSDYSHTLSGLFWFDIPLGLLLAFTFHNIVRDLLFENLPLFFKSRFAAFKQFNWNAYFSKNWAAVIISILLGAFSHLLWDSFTHENGYFVKTIPALTNTITLLGYSVPVLKILQHSSTLLGALVIAWAIYQLPTDYTIKSHINSKFWTIWTGVALIIIAIRFFSGLDITQYGHLVVTCISAGLLSLTLTSWLIKTAL